MLNKIWNVWNNLELEWSKVNAKKKVSKIDYLKTLICWSEEKGTNAVEQIKVMAAKDLNSDSPLEEVEKYNKLAKALEDVVDKIKNAKQDPVDLNLFVWSSENELNLAEEAADVIDFQDYAVYKTPQMCKCKELLKNNLVTNSVFLKNGEPVCLQVENNNEYVRFDTQEATVRWLQNFNPDFSSEMETNLFGMIMTKLTNKENIALPIIVIDKNMFNVEAEKIVAKGCKDGISIPLNTSKRAGTAQKSRFEANFVNFSGEREQFEFDFFNVTKGMTKAGPINFMVM